MHENYQVMARRWRPQRFDELVGQEWIIKTLENEIRLNRIAHAFLFIGPRGTGKTSMARLVAMALNAPEHPNIEMDPTQEPCRSIFEGYCIDVIEIDGASNNSVEQIRNLCEECQYAPTTCRFKIYIIDEVHMLSQSAFNALLKTLEEPPKHVKFIFATTEAYKIPQTIVSRCQRFEFRPISETVIVHKLEQITQQENIHAEPLALQAIARLADGGMRDAQSILDQITSFGNNIIKEKDVVNAYGLISVQELSAIINCIENADYEGIIGLTKQLKHCNFMGILSDIGKQLHSKLFTLQDSSEIAKTLKILDIIISSKDFLPSGNVPEIMFQLVLFRAIEALQRRSIDQVISLIRKMQNISENKESNMNNCHQLSPEIEDSCEDNLGSADKQSSSLPSFQKTEIKNGNIDIQKNTANFDQLPENTREKLKNLFHIEE